MQLRDFLSPQAIDLDLEGDSKDKILRELVALLHFDSGSEPGVLKILKRRELSGSTGVGRGFAIPHCRFPGCNELRVAYGRKAAGVEFDAIDHQPVQHFFLIVAPPIEAANLYLPVLGRIAETARKEGANENLLGATSPTELLDVITALEQA